MPTKSTVNTRTKPKSVKKGAGGKAILKSGATNGESSLKAKVKKMTFRSDIKIGTLEKRLGLTPGAIRNPDGTDARSDKTLGSLQKDYIKAMGPKIQPYPYINKESKMKIAHLFSK